MDKDLVSNIFFSDNDRYADIINGIGCEGIPFVRGEDLQELDAREIFGRRKGYGRNRAVTGTKYRDLIRKTRFGVNFAIIGIENQEEIDYSLALRVMCYDAGKYERQAAEIRKRVRRDGRDLSAGEYLYGFKKDSRLFPTVTFVLYYGEEEWDGARDLHGLLDFTDIPESLRKKVSNYQLHIIEVRRLQDTGVFQTDVKQVFDFIRFSKDKDKLKELVETDQAYSRLEEDACDMLAAYVEEEEDMFKRMDKHKKDGRVNMCQGLREWMEDERMEGRMEGKIEGKAEMLIELLTEYGNASEQLKGRIMKEKNEVLLHKWIKLAARVTSVEEFEREM